MHVAPQCLMSELRHEDRRHLRRRQQHLGRASSHRRSGRCGAASRCRHAPPLRSTVALIHLRVSNMTTCGPRSAFDGSWLHAPGTSASTSRTSARGIGHRIHYSAGAPPGSAPAADPGRPGGWCYRALPWMPPQTPGTGGWAHCPAPADTIRQF